MQKLTLTMIVLAALTTTLGCESPAPPANQASEMTQPPPEPEAAAEAPAPAAAEPKAPSPDGGQPAAEPAADGAADPAAEAPAEGEELKKAEPGVGVKGKDYGGPGFVTTPIETMFKVEDRIAFEIQIPKAMDLYKADHNNKGPKTHEEFMNVIIKEHAVQLPELPPGNVYWYDAKTEQLMVRTEKKDS